MGTRALIGYLDTDGDTRLTSTYNHYDGYPSNLGKGLTKFYNNDAKAEEIANVGYISYLNPETGKWDAANKQQPEVDQLPDDFNEAMMEIAEIVDSFGANYGYIWDNEKEQWMLIKNDGIRGMSKDLEIQLAHLKDKFSISPDRSEQDIDFDDENFSDALIDDPDSLEEGSMSVIDKAKAALKGKENLDAYIESLTNDISKNKSKTYTDYTVDDWVEDYESNGFASYSMKEHMITKWQHRAGIIK